MKKKINSKRIVKHVGTGILLTALTVGSGVVIYDATIEHTEKICPFAKMIDHSIELSDGTEIPVGMVHQIQQMKSEYEREGKSVLVAYSSEHRDTKETYITTSAIQVLAEDGTIEYVAPIGYELIEIDGVYYAVKREISIESEPYEAIVTYYRDVENNYTGKTRVLKIGD